MATLGHLASTQWKALPSRRTGRFTLLMARVPLLNSNQTLFNDWLRSALSAMTPRLCTTRFVHSYPFLFINLLTSYNRRRTFTAMSENLLKQLCEFSPRRLGAATLKLPSLSRIFRPRPVQTQLTNTSKAQNLVFSPLNSLETVK